jgi:hypothetical protein
MGRGLGKMMERVRAERKGEGQEERKGKKERRRAGGGGEGPAGGGWATEALENN